MFTSFKSTLLSMTIAVAFCGICASSNADVVVSMSFEEDSIVDTLQIAEGTASVEAYLHFVGTGADAGGTFTGFRYAIEATPGDAARTPGFQKPITVANLNPQLQAQNWAVADGSAAGGSNQLGGDVNAPAGSGLQGDFGGYVMQVSLDTSILATGDSIVLNPNIFDSASVSDGNGAISATFNTASLSVSAVPEPTSVLILMGCALPAMLQRRRG